MQASCCPCLLFHLLGCNFLEFGQGDPWTPTSFPESLFSPGLYLTEYFQAHTWRGSSLLSQSPGLWFCFLTYSIRLGSWTSSYQLNKPITIALKFFHAQGQDTYTYIYNLHDWWMAPTKKRLITFLFSELTFPKIPQLEAYSLFTVKNKVLELTRVYSHRKWSLWDKKSQIKLYYPGAFW